MANLIDALLHSADNAEFDRDDAISALFEDLKSAKTRLDQTLEEFRLNADNDEGQAANAVAMEIAGLILELTQVRDLALQVVALNRYSLKVRKIVADNR